MAVADLTSLTKHISRRASIAPSSSARRCIIPLLNISLLTVHCLQLHQVPVRKAGSGNKKGKKPAEMEILEENSPIVIAATAIAPKRRHSAGARRLSTSKHEILFQTHQEFALEIGHCAVRLEGSNRRHAAPWTLLLSATRAFPRLSLL